MAANDRQEGGLHYKKAGVQHWDAIKHWMTPEQYIGYLLGSASKYLARYNDKGGVEGAKKSIHYLEKLIEFVRGLPKTPAPMSVEDGDGESNLPTQLRLPKSDENFVYEGGSKDYDLWRCRKCSDHFKTPLENDPGQFHFHSCGYADPLTITGEPGQSYVNQDK